MTEDGGEESIVTAQYGARSNGLAGYKYLSSLLLARPLEARASATSP